MEKPSRLFSFSVTPTSSHSFYRNFFKIYLNIPLGNFDIPSKYGCWLPLKWGTRRNTFKFFRITTSKQYPDHGPVSRAGKISGPEKKGPSYQIRCRFYPEKRTRGEKGRLCSFGYKSVEEAQADQELFRFAVDLDAAVDWQSPAQLRLAGGVVSESQME